MIACSSAKQSESGFTFIEIILAVTILAIAASITIGLQAASISRTIEDRNTQTALLAGRQILSMLEINEANLDNLDRDSSLSSLFSEYKVPITDDEGGKKELERFTGHLAITDWPIPGMSKGGMKQIALRISWGSEDFEGVDLLYFTPAPEQQQ